MQNFKGDFLERRLFKNDTKRNCKNIDIFFFTLSLKQHSKKKDVRFF